VLQVNLQAKHPSCRPTNSLKEAKE